MTERAKIFQNGGSQAVRLPKSCRFPDDQSEVIVRRDGNRVILEPAEEWSKEFLEMLGAWNEEIEVPRGRPMSETKDPFEGGPFD
jgi:antitoxin VapB